MADKLTPEQRQAVENRGGKLLVSAAAGSGKTKVLVDRLMGYILDPVNPANIDDFLIITYTKAAAAELRGKIAAKLSETIASSDPNKHLQQQMQRLYLAKISTVHGFCGDIIRQYAYKLDVSADFRVADESEVLQLQLKALDQVLNNAYETGDDHSSFYNFIDSQGLGRDDRQIPEIILKVFNSARCHLDPEKWLDWCISGVYSDVTDAGQTPWGAYLIDDLKEYLCLQISAFSKCVEKASYIEGFEKPLALFKSTIDQLQALLACNTWDEIKNSCIIDYGRLVFPKNCTDLQLAEQMKAVREACKSGLAKRLRAFSDPSQLILEDLAKASSSANGLITLVRAFTREYDRLKRNRNILDFGDLEHKTLDLLLGSRRDHITAVANEIAGCFREIMVDEYQDSNQIQDAIFSAISDQKQNCFMVGDVKQSIYQFRLADPSIFIEKYNTYIPAEKAKTGEGRKIMLSHNFRSSAGVISGVNDVFMRCMTPATGGIAYGEKEMLREGIPHISILEPEVSLYGIEVEDDTYEEEAQFVSSKICELLDGTHYVRNGEERRPILPEDILILLRSPGSMSSSFEKALQSKGIRYVTGDSADLLQTDEIAIVRSILEIIYNPLQDIPLVAALTSPVFGYTADELANLRSENRGVSVYKMLLRSDREKDKNFLSVLNNLRTDARWLSVSQLLTKLYCGTNLIGIFSAMDNGNERLENLQEFFQIVSDYESTGPRELGRLLDYLNSAEERGLSKSAGQNDSGAVTIMSIHKSKGLEFPVVFLCGLSRGFNHESAYAQVLCDKDLGLGLGCIDQKLRARFPSIAKRAISVKTIREGVSEEMRVLYVAMTRARDRLIMTY
ncbi:MAG: UvrD-helicase domain-containing protein, partial [Oscillospiraceae bacterium]|nr:UvrD-helicase domain-containing protein [Oscillospiraceae bacterium]